MSTRKTFFALILFVAISSLLAACGGGAVPDASKTGAQSKINQGQIAPAEELRVAEYLQYYKQNFPAPVNSTLGLDVRPGNPQIPGDGGEVWLQIGVQARTAETEQVAPLNVALVLDCSGSMDASEKMPYLKQSLKFFLTSLAANDTVAIVTFSTDARLLVPARRVGDGNWIDAAIASLRPDGNTNLYAGLMLGFQEVQRNFDIRLNNRVILLTDGIANVGITDPNRIASDARAFNDRGIFLSTIGLGRDFNDNLLSQLARQGKGGYHFVASAAEMDKIFRQEVTGLFQKTATDVSVVIQPAPGVIVESITGYDGRPPAGPVQVKLFEMGTGDSQVVLVRLNVGRSGLGRRELANVDLHYRDLFKQRDQADTQPVVVNVDRISQYDPLYDVEVLRNVTIQRTAEGLKEIDRLYKSGRYQAAWDLAYGLEQALRAVARLTHEEQMNKDADMMHTYQNTLSRWVQRDTGRLPVPPASDPDVPLNRDPLGRLPTMTPDASIIEIR